MDKKSGSRLDARGARDILKTSVCSLWTFTVALCLVSFSFCPAIALGAEPWPGVDEAVVEKFAREHGRESREPLINTDQGDLLLFAFLLAGTAGGFAAGYYWRMLLEGKAGGRENGKGRKI